MSVTIAADSHRWSWWTFNLQHCRAVWSWE